MVVLQVVLQVVIRQGCCTSNDCLHAVVAALAGDSLTVLILPLCVPAELSHSAMTSQKRLPAPGTQAETDLSWARALEY